MTESAVREGAVQSSGGEHRPASSRTSLTAELVGSRRRWRFGFCVYCGRPTATGPACDAHRDLVALERAEWAA